MSMKYNICKLCKLAGVSRSGYYKWLNGTERFTDRAKENKIIKQSLLFTKYHRYLFQKRKRTNLVFK